MAAFTPLGQNAVIVRVTSYDRKRPSGTLVSPRLEKAVSFGSLTQLLLLMESLMDQSNQPQRGEAHRAVSRARPGGGAAAPRAGALQKALATFQIRVLFRQNASWQGSLIWVEPQMDAQFRSVLELIRLMDSALSAGEGEQTI